MNIIITDTYVYILTQFYQLNLQPLSQSIYETLMPQPASKISKLPTTHNRSTTLNPIKQQSYINPLNRQQQHKLYKLFDEEQIQSYFNTIQNNNHISIDTIQYAGALYSDVGVRKIVHDIRDGKTNIRQQQNNVNDYFIKKKISEEEQRNEQLKLKRKEILRQLDYLDAQTSRITQSANKLSLANPQKQLSQQKPANINYKKSLKILSKQQHELYIQDVLKQRTQLDEKHQKNIQMIQKSISNKQKKDKQRKQKKINRERLKRKKQIQITLEKKKQQHQKILAEEKQTNRKYQEVKKKKFLHQKFQQKYQNDVILPALEEQKKKLKEIREISKGFNINDILLHQKQYKQKRNQSFSMIKSRAKQDWHYQPPERTQKLSRVIQQQKIQQRKKLQEHKRKIDEKISRQQTYINYLKQKFTPTIDQNKQKQIELRLYKQKNRRRPSQDAKILGISYLQQSKKLRKKNIDHSLTEQQKSRRTTQMQQKPKKIVYTNYLALAHDRQYYEAKRRKRLTKLITSDTTDQTQKITKLKIQTQKINQELKRRQQLIKLHINGQKDQDEALQLLLSGIQAKMGIISIYKNHIQ